MKSFLFALFVMCSIVVFADQGDTYDFPQTLSKSLNKKAVIDAIVIPEQDFPVKGVAISCSYNGSYEKAVDITVSVGEDIWETKTIGMEDGVQRVEFSGISSHGEVIVSFVNRLTASSGCGTFKVSNVQLIEGSDDVEKHNATFFANGEQINVEEYGEGETIAFPQVESPIDDGIVFVGWSEDVISGYTANASLIGDNEKMGDADRTFYAVYSLSGNVSQQAFLLNVVTSTGTKVYVSARQGNRLGYTFTESEAQKFILDDSGMLSFYSGGELTYVYGELSGELYFTTELTEASPWKLDTQEDGTITLKTSAGYYLAYNSGRYFSAYNNATYPKKFTLTPVEVVGETECFFTNMDAVTAVHEVHSLAPNTTNLVYDMMGRVQSRTSKGINVVSGKKYSSR